MRFGSVDMFMEFGDWGFRMGRPIANEGFLKALLTHGTYDAYEFFCPDVHHMERFWERVQFLVRDSSLLSRVKVSLQAALSESVRSERYHAFHQGDFTYFMPFLAGIRNRCARHPFPITGVTHSLDGVFMNLRYLELAMAGLTPGDGIICTSRAARSAVEKSLSWVQTELAKTGFSIRDGEVHLREIPLGIDDTFFGESHSEEARAYFHIPEDVVVALSVGRISSRQKTDWSPVLELLARMYAGGKIENMVLIIAGGGEESQISLLKLLIGRMGLEKRVILFPNFPADIKTLLYQTADFYLSPVDNFQETFGMSVVEAMASGLPVIASDFSGYRELVRDGENGYLIPTFWTEELPEFLSEGLGILDPSLSRFYLSQMVALDLKRLEEALTSLCTNRELRKGMGAASRSKASSYSWMKIIRSYETLWDDLRRWKNKTPLHPTHGPDILGAGPVERFSHYPSQIISGEDRIILTPLGSTYLKDRSMVTRYEDVEVCLFKDLEDLILSALERGERPIDDLKREAQRALGATGGQVLFEILWLIKHGLAALQSSGGISKGDFSHDGQG